MLEKVTSYIYNNLGYWRDGLSDCLLPFLHLVLCHPKDVLLLVIDGKDVGRRLGGQVGVRVLPAEPGVVVLVLNMLAIPE